MANFCLKFIRSVAAVCLVAFIGMSFLQISLVKCCDEGEICPVSGTHSDIDHDGVNTFFDCFTKKQASAKNNPFDSLKKIKEIGIFTVKIPLPYFTGFDLIHFNTFLKYKDPLLRGPLLPG